MGWVSATLWAQILCGSSHKEWTCHCETVQLNRIGFLDCHGRQLLLPVPLLLNLGMKTLCSLCTLSHFSHVRLFASLWTVACQAPLSMGILQARILEWVAVLPLGNLANPGPEPTSLMSPALAGRFFTASATWEAPCSLLPVNCSFLISFLGSLPWFFPSPILCFPSALCYPPHCPLHLCAIL